MKALRSLFSRFTVEKVTVKRAGIVATLKPVTDVIDQFAKGLRDNAIEVRCGGGHRGSFATASGVSGRSKRCRGCPMPQKKLEFPRTLMLGESCRLALSLFLSPGEAAAET